MEALNKVQHSAAENLYKQAQSGGGPSASSEGGGPSGQASGGKQGDVIDAEVVDDK
jgi:hypothetical protein